ncbi:MAG: MATE family efflux transporter [Clostridia bacterium]|nr:MATE family efflux transporter [Clostridia bacterium]
MKKFIGDKAFYRRLFAVMLPILLQNVITNFVSLLDNVMVGRIGTEQMSGVAIVNQLMFVYNLAIFGGISGAGIFTAQFFGGRDNEGVRHTVRMKYYTVFIVLVLFTGAFLAFGDKLIMLFLHESTEDIDIGLTLAYGREYLAVMLIQMLPFALMQVYAGTLRETGVTRLPMAAGVIAICLNLVLNYLLIFGKLGLPALGVRGAAIATVTARFAECAIVVVIPHLRTDKFAYLKGLFSSFRVPRRLVGNMIAKGAPLMVNELLWSLGMTILNQCYSYKGPEVIPAVSISSTASNLFFCAFFAMGSTVSIMIGQLLGAGEFERAVDEDRKLIAFSIALCTAVGAVMAAVAHLIPELYNTIDSVKELAASLLIVSACMMPVDAFTNAAYFTLRSGGKTFITFLFDSGFVWVVCVPAAFIISHFTDIPIIPMFIIVRGLDVIKCVVGYVFIKRRAWVHNLTLDNRA